MFNKNQSLKVIENAKINNTFSHAYLFFGEPGVDVIEVAFEAVKLMICNTNKCMKSKTFEELNYPDLLVINPEKKLITKNDIVSTIKNMSNTSLVNNNKKILIINDIDLGNKFSLNSLLKYMEDPSYNTHIIMTTNKIDMIITTIKSRSQNILVKRKTINQIIDDFVESKIDKKYTRLFANIFPSIEKIKQVDMTNFEKIYQEIFIALNFGLLNPNEMKIKLSKYISKENVNYLLCILEYFYYQLKTSIDEKFPLFPNHKSLINKYKIRNKDYGPMLQEISIFRKNLNNKGNFNLQKENFLLRMVKIYEG